MRVPMIRIFLLSCGRHCQIFWAVGSSIFFDFHHHLPTRFFHFINSGAYRMQHDASWWLQGLEIEGSNFVVRSRKTGYEYSMWCRNACKNNPSVTISGFGFFMFNSFGSANTLQPQFLKLKGFQIFQIALAMERVIFIVSGLCQLPPMFPVWWKLTTRAPCWSEICQSWLISGMISSCPQYWIDQKWSWMVWLGSAEDNDCRQLSRNENHGGEHLQNMVLRLQFLRGVDAVEAGSPSHIHRFKKSTDIWWGSNHPMNDNKKLALWSTSSEHDTEH